MSLAALAIIISVLSLYVSGRVAWETTFRPAKLVAVMPHCVMWQFSSWRGDKPTGVVVSRNMTPYLRIRNFGAKPVVIEDLRLCFIGSEGKVFAYPVSKVPQDVIEAPGNNTRRHGLGEGAPFSGIALASGEEWMNSYAFSMAVKDYEQLINDVKLVVEIRRGGQKIWEEVLNDIFSFGSMPFHLQPLKTATIVAGSMNNHVYSKRWNDARKR